MCQANMPAHWVESARDPVERRRREAVLDALFRMHGGSVPGPLLLDFIRRWPKPSRGAGAAQRAWERGEFVKPRGRSGKIKAVVYRGRTMSPGEFRAHLSA